MRDGGRPLWDYLAQALAFPADQATAEVTRMPVHWLLEGSTPSWDRRQHIVADTLTVAGFRMEGSKPVLLTAARELDSDVRWTLDCLQLKVPERTFSEEPALTGGGRKFLLQVQGLLEDV